MIYKYDKHLDFLFSLHRHGIKLGLEHTYRLLKFVGNPHDKIITIHVAGTNGKGSTCAHIEKILRCGGYKVGIYTSPHLVHFNERIRVNGLPITDKEIICFLNNTTNKIKDIKSTFFETTTVMAFDYFNKKKVDVAIIETGLGGRLDATNVIRPAISVITSISKDHTEILGNTFEEIAVEKAGIIKERTPVIVYQQGEKIMDIFKEKASNCNAPIKISKRPDNININLDGVKFSINNQIFITPLLGSHQACNATLAIDVVRTFDPKLNYNIIYKGIEKVFWPGRMQKITANIFYDVSHNENGLKKTLKTLKELYPYSNIYGLFCMKREKNLISLKNQLKKNFTNLLVAEDKNRMLLDSNIIAKELTKFHIKNKLVKSIQNGVIILKKLVKNNAVGLIFGSHYIAEEVFNEFEISFDNYDI